jgi:aspartate/glutamate racemase
MEAIYGVKGAKVESDIKKNRDKLNQAIKMMLPKNPQAIIAGCTEVELALQGFYFDLSIFFPLEILANEIVKLATN